VNATEAFASADAHAAPGAPGRKLRVVVLTPIWPNEHEPLLGPYNVLQLGKLRDRIDVEVLCAVPWFPMAARTGQPARAAMLAGLPDRADVQGMPTRYLRQLYLPRLGLPIAVPLLGASLAPHLGVVRRADVVLATWAYPHGCAAVAVAEALGKPAVVKVHGSDVNVIAKHPAARLVMSQLLPRARAMVTMSRALGDELALVGVPRDRIHLVQNGVDTAVFHARDRAEARRGLGLPADALLVLFVGSLKREKGVCDLLQAFAEVRATRPRARLVLLGEGPARADVEAARATLGEALHAPGGVPAAVVADWLAACDVFTLPSWMEGQPNVVLEALACGRPVVGSRVGGIPDALEDLEAGMLVPAQDPAALAAALGAALEKRWDVDAVRRSAPGSWDESADALWQVIRGAHAAHVMHDRPR